MQDKSARESLQTFVGGKGDVLLAYENEAITAQQKGEELDYVVPDETILIENPIAVTEGENQRRALEFVEFVRSREGQQVFVDKGYRSVREDLNGDFPTPPGLFEIGRFGGWDRVATEFFDPQDSVLADLFRDLGVATG